MRLIHLSDIHLSKANFHEFSHHYINSLISDLKYYHNSISVDLIIITGDLVDKGGHSLLELDRYNGEENPFDIFEKAFIDPIARGLGISKSKFLFIPGNHDVNEKEISYFEECEMVDSINHDTIEGYLAKNKNVFNYNKRIKNFKDFERKYHESTPLYNYSNNHSTYVYKNKENINVGFILTNDSWRCKTRKFEDEFSKLYFGYHQLDHALESLKGSKTSLNICLLHHSLEDYEERLEVERILSNGNISVFLYGHYHNNKFDMLYNSIGTTLGLRARAALNRPNEKLSEYQPGYQIIDLDPISLNIIRIHYRKFIYKRSSFDYDVEAATNGIDDNNLLFKLTSVTNESAEFSLKKDNFFKK